MATRVRPKPRLRSTQIALALLELRSLYLACQYLRRQPWNQPIILNRLNLLTKGQLDNSLNAIIQIAEIAADMEHNGE